MKGGRFLAPAVVPVGTEGWTAVSDSKGMRYVDAANNEHPFTRSENYMASNKAIQQVEGEEPAEAGATGPVAGAGGATKSKW